MSEPASGVESHAEGGRVFYKGWVYARTCGHELGLPAENQTRRGLCTPCYLWAQENGYWDDHEPVRKNPQDLIEDIEVGAITTVEEALEAGYTRENLYARLRASGRMDLYRRLTT